jgi:DNA-binding CsgD family transcriptional regulator
METTVSPSRKFLSTIPQAMVAGIEFFFMNGEIQFMENGSMRLFMELDVNLAARIRESMENDPKAMKGLEIMGIEDPVEQLKQYVYCNFGEFNKIADISSDGDIHPEYWDCGNRPCPADGLLCKLPGVVHGKLTPHDASVIREIGSDKPNKIIAADFNRSKFTIDTEIRGIARKIGCFTKAGISSFAGRHNIY